MALWPAGQSVYGWQRQRALRAAWNKAAAQHKMVVSQKRHHQKFAAAFKGKVPASRIKVKTPAVPKARPKLHLAQAHHASPARHRVHPVAPIQSYTSLTGLPPLRLVIPSIGLDAMVVEGVDATALSQGPGHDPTSALPGFSGNCVIAAHRNMYGWWFYHLGKLGRNATIQLQTPVETFTYKVAKTVVVHTTDTAILGDPTNPTAAPRLTLYTCAIPHGSRRIIVVANQVESKP